MIPPSIPVHRGTAHTTRVMTSGQQNTTSSLPLSNDVRSSRRAQDAIVSDNELLDPIRSSNLRNDLCDLWVPKSAITANNQCTSLDAFRDREERCCYKGLGVVGLLKDLDLLSETGTTLLSAIYGNPTPVCKWPGIERVSIGTRSYSRPGLLILEGLKVNCLRIGHCGNIGYAMLFLQLMDVVSSCFYPFHLNLNPSSLNKHQQPHVILYVSPRHQQRTNEHVTATTSCQSMVRLGI